MSVYKCAILLTPYGQAIAGTSSPYYDENTGVAGYGTNLFTSSTSTTLRLVANMYGVAGAGPVSKWANELSCAINRPTYSGSFCFQSMLNEMLTETTNGVVNYTDVYNVLTWQGRNKFYYYDTQDEGQGPSCSGNQTFAPIPDISTCLSNNIGSTITKQYNTGGRALKITCKSVCGSVPFSDRNLNATWVSLAQAMMDNNLPAAKLTYWSDNAGVARVRCRVTLTGDATTLSTCPDVVYGVGIRYKGRSELTGQYDTNS